jgi:site-specific DNA-cytosine methylase
LKIGNSNTEARYTVGHPFCGMGLGAKGFQDAESRLFGQTARFKCVGGIDLDAKACAMFERLTKSPALVADVATLTPEALRKFWPTAPDVIFTSPPCKGYSQLTSKKARTSKKYQDMKEKGVTRGFAIGDWKPAGKKGARKSLTVDVVAEHVAGRRTLGFYPLHDDGQVNSVSVVSVLNNCRTLLDRLVLV